MVRQTRRRKRAQSPRNARRAVTRVAVLGVPILALAAGGFAVNEMGTGNDRTASYSGAPPRSESVPSASASTEPSATADVLTATPTPNPTPDPTPTATTPPPTGNPDEPKPADPETSEVVSGPFPNMDSTGPRVERSAMESSGSITTERDGQVIEKRDVASQLKIIHDDVTVRDVRVTQTGHYGIHITKKNDGGCPENVVVEHSELVGDTSEVDDEGIGVFGHCPLTLRNSRVHNIGSAVRITNGSRVENNYIHADYFIAGSGAHRSAIGLNGGADHVIKGNTIDCEGPGCSGALVMYGDFAQVKDVLIEANLFNTTGSYCTYAGSVSSKEYPSADNVRYLGNHFGRKYFDTCGRYGPVTARGGNTVWEDNVWDDNGDVVE